MKANRSGFLVGAAFVGAAFVGAASIGATACRPHTAARTLPAVAEAPLPPPEAAAPKGPLAWESFDSEIFVRSAAAKKFVLLDNSAEWCHWCHVMEAVTYHDPAIRSRLDARFLTAKVDVDERPDLEERYRNFGWPATVIFSPEGKELGVFQGYLTPDELAAVLDEATGARAPESPSESLLGRTTGNAPALLATGPLTATRFAEDRTRIDRVLENLWDSRAYGWGDFQKAPVGWADLWLLEKARRGVPGARERVAQVLDAEGQIHDPVFGGIYQYSVGKTWKEPHFEKLGALQALSLWADAEAAVVLREADAVNAATPAALRAQARADRTFRYIQRFLRAPEGGFYTSQDADVGAHLGNGDAKRGFLDGHAYYALPEAERLSYGVPRIDRGEYSKENGLFVLAYLAYARTGHPEAAAEATRAMDRFLATHRPKEGLFRWFSHAPIAGESSTEAANPRVGQLADQVYIGLALTALADPSVLAASSPLLEKRQRDRYAEEARAVVRALEASFAAPDGGFYGTTEDAGARGIFAQRRKPIDENALAALFLLKYIQLSGEKDGATLQRALAAAAAVTAPAAVDARGRMVAPILFAADAAAKNARQ